MPNPTFNETKLKQKIYQVLKTYPDTYFRKISTPFRAGLLDLFICKAGKCTWIELKVLPNQPTPLQYREMESIWAAGGNAYCLLAKPDQSCFYLLGPFRAEQDGDTVEYASLEQLLKEVLSILPMSILPIEKGVKQNEGVESDF